MIQVRSHKNFRLTQEFYLIGGIGSSVVTSISILGSEQKEWKRKEIDILDST